MTITKLKMLKNRLIRKGVSYKHASRYIRELEHHYDDLFVEAKSRGLNDQTASFMAEQALGDEQELLDEMTSRPELQGIDQRFPKLYYLVLPVTSFLLIGTGLLLAFIGIMMTFFDSSAGIIEPAAWVKTAVDFFLLFLMHGLAPLTSLFFLFLGLRHQISRWFLFSGIFLVNLISCAMFIHVQWADPAAGIEQGSIGGTIGYGLYDGFRWSNEVLSTKFRLLLTLLAIALLGWGYQRFLIRD